MKITVFDTTPSKLGYELEEFFRGCGKFEVIHMVQSESSRLILGGTYDTHVTLTVVWKPLD